MSQEKQQSTAASDAVPPIQRSKKVSDNYVLRLGSLKDDREDILTLWQYLPGDPPPQGEKLDWFYRSSPAGEGVVYFLDYIPEQRPVGVVCLGRRRFQMGAERFDGAVFGDFAVEPKHRSLGPALFFQIEFLKRAREQFDVVYGFPNELSGKVRVFGGFKLDAELGIFVRPLDYRHYLKRHIPSPLAVLGGNIANAGSAILLHWRTRRTRSMFSESAVQPRFIDRVWQRVAATDVHMGIRDAAFIDWRLSQNPYRQFEMIGVCDRNGEPAGYAAFSTKGGAIDVIDFLAVSVDASRALFAYIIKAKSAQARAISVCMSTFDAPAVAWLGGMQFSQRHCFMYFVSVSDRVAILGAKQAIRLNIADNDA